MVKEIAAPNSAVCCGEVVIAPNGIARCARTKMIPGTDVLVGWLNAGKRFDFNLTLATRKAEANGLIPSCSVQQEFA